MIQEQQVVDEITQRLWVCVRIDPPGNGPLVGRKTDQNPFRPAESTIKIRTHGSQLLDLLILTSKPLGENGPEA